MNETEKYLIHASIAADGVVERSDVVGAVFGQTEGLLGDELDLRDLQESSRVGRIDVTVESENGQSFGEVTVASRLDKVETAILAAALETIDRIGPCQASLEVTSIEDVRAAKRREVVERAKELLAGGFEETSLASDDVLAEVRDAARVEGIADYEGLPAGPRVGDSDAVIIVEGRADVSTLLDCGIKNAVAVEGTNVPDAVADLTESRTVTAFLDGDRGGELILRELAQVGDVDYVAFAPPGESVEDLDRSAVFEALRGKVPYASLADEPNLREAADERESDVTDAVEPPDSDSETEDGSIAAGDEDTTADEDDAIAADGVGSATAPPKTRSESAEDPAASADDSAVVEGDDGGEDTVEDDDADERGAAKDHDATDERDTDEGTDEDDDTAEQSDAAGPGGDASDTALEDAEPRSIEEHVQEVVDAESGRARLLGDDLGVLTEVDAASAFDAVEDAETAPETVVVDGRIDQRLLDVAAQRGVSELLGREVGEFVKRPIGTRVLTVGDLRAGS
ncbi:DNA primase [Halorubrum sp. CBA1125]|uniref:DNA primase DnaG n=1 Tax=Halorubrum sp. CBA1125 TaxID=2668072 RepID=UPI0012E97C5A|nr:DNA primase DnaG [Halorubrum sp. CBA1125]MUW14116.1 DNA primase [Halorubrum sp. CBA1125]